MLRVLADKQSACYNLPDGGNNDRIVFRMILSDVPVVRLADPHVARLQIASKRTINLSTGSGPTRNAG